MKPVFSYIYCILLLLAAAPTSTFADDQQRHYGHQPYEAAPTLRLQSAKVLPPGMTIKLLPEAAKAFKKMQDEAGRHEVIIMLSSGYRGLAKQGDLFREAVEKYGSEEEAACWVAPPGYSEHQTGLAIDVTGPDKALLYDWVEKYAGLFGFERSFPIGDPEHCFEPWHLRYVGMPLASQRLSTTLLNGITVDSERVIDELVNRMTLEEKIGQLLMVGFAGAGSDDLASRLVREFNIGSVILFERNIKSLEDGRVPVDSIEAAREVAALCNSLQDLASETSPKIPLLIAVDQENGSAMTIEKGITPLPGSMAIGATRSGEYAFEAGRITGEELRAMGVHLNLAPVADINTNKDTDILGPRSFGGEKSLVARLSVQFMKGLHSGGVLSAAKHFPGHGDSSVDPHNGLPVVSYSRARMERVNMVPFNALVEAGVDAIMTTHMEFPGLTEEEGLPLSLSKKAVSELIRGRLGFEGVVITDDLTLMGAVTEHGRTIRKAATLAIEGASDVLMFAHIAPSNDGANFNLDDLKEVIDDLAAYFKEKPGQLDRSVKRVLRLKLKRNNSLDPFAWKVDLIRMEGAVRTPEKLKWAQMISDDSITLVNDSFDLFAGESYPFQGVRPTDPILVVLPVYKVDYLTGLIVESGYNELRVIHLGYGAPGEFQEKISKGAEYIVDKSSGAKMIIFGIANNLHARVLERVLKGIDIPVVAIAFSEPNMLSSKIINELTYLAAYSDTITSNESVARVLTGKVRPKPRKFLPVSIQGLYNLEESGAKVMPHD